MKLMKLSLAVLLIISTVSFAGWEKLSSLKKVNEIIATSDGTLYAYARQDTFIYRSNDFGESWKMVFLDPYVTNYLNITDIDLDDDTLYVAYDDGILKASPASADDTLKFTSILYWTWDEPVSVDFENGYGWCYINMYGSRSGINYYRPGHGWETTAGDGSYVLTDPLKADSVCYGAFGANSNSGSELTLDAGKTWIDFDFNPKCALVIDDESYMIGRNTYTTDHTTLHSLPTLFVMSVAADPDTTIYFSYSGWDFNAPLSGDYKVMNEIFMGGMDQVYRTELKSVAAMKCLETAGEYLIGLDGDGYLYRVKLSEITPGDLVLYSQKPVLTVEGDPENQSDSLVFNWSEPVENLVYRVFISTDSTTTDNIYYDAYEEDITCKTFSITGELEGQTTYWVWVQGYDIGNRTGYSDPVRIFTAFPARPVIYTPEDNARIDSVNVLASWSSAGAGATYQLQMSKGWYSFNEDEILIDTTFSADTTFLFKGLKSNSEYHFRVRAQNQKGTSQWSYTRTFETSGPPCPTLQSPDHLSSNMKVCQKLIWEQNDNDITEFHVQAGRDDDFWWFSSSYSKNDSIMDIRSITNQYLDWEFPSGTTVYWRVRCFSPTRGWSEWSATWKFTTGKPENTPVIINPNGDYWSESVHVNFSWEADTTFDRYKLILYDDYDFDDLLKEIETEDNELTAILPANNYTYWKLQGYNEYGYSDPVEGGKIHTGSKDAALILEPADNETVNTDLQVVWSSSPAAYSYRLQICTNFYFYPDSTVIFDHAGITDTTYYVQLNTNQTKLYVRVKVDSSEYGDGCWSSNYRNFYISTEIDDAKTTLPQGFILHQNYPNPFNPSTTISYTLPRTVFVRIEIFDDVGKLIKVLVNERKEAGRYAVKWEAEVSSGIYFYRIIAGNYHAVKKMIFIK